MSSYPSSAIETAREIVTQQEIFPSLCVLSDLAKRKISLKKKTELVNTLFEDRTPSDNTLVQILLDLNYEYVTGFSPATEEQQRLGIGPDGRYRHEEFLVGKLLEYAYKNRFFRYYENNDYDFFCENETYDVIGPVPPYYFEETSFLDSFYAHLDKQGLDHIVACTVSLPCVFQKSFTAIVGDLPIEIQNKILIIDEEFCENLDHEATYLLPEQAI